MPKLCVEYAKSGRAKCSGCKQTILKNELRIGIEVQFPGGDEPILSWQWRHLCCFTDRQIINAEKAGTLTEIEGYEALEAADKALVDELKKGKLLDRKDLIGKVSVTKKVVPAAKKKPRAHNESTPKDKKRKKENTPVIDLPNDTTEDFEVDIATSDAPLCPYGEKCNEPGSMHFQQYSHGPGQRPFAKATKRNSTHSE